MPCNNVLEVVREFLYEVSIDVNSDLETADDKAGQAKVVRIQQPSRTSSGPKSELQHGLQQRARPRI